MIVAGSEPDDEETKNDILVGGGKVHADLDIANPGFIRGRVFLV